MKRTTIKDLSQYLSLSTSTISRALLNDVHIHPDTKKRVLEAAQKFNYKPNATALSLKYGKTNSIGFVVPEMITPFSAKVLQGVQNILYPLGYKVIILQSDEDPSRERENLLLLETFNVDGIILNLCHETFNQNLYIEIMQRGTPLVFFDRIPATSLDVSKVLVDDHIKASLMVEHLVRIGCRRIAHIMGPATVRNSAERASGYKRILTKHGIFDPELIIKTDGTMFEHGKMAVKKLFDKKIEFDGIFAFTDTEAIGAMNYLLEAGVKVPDEVAVASFSGTELSTNVFPQLSSVEQPLEKMGETAAELVLEKIKDDGAVSKSIVLNAELVYRASTLAKDKLKKQ
ncbi:LacI family transcriptional regulator [Pontibacter sp. E15-1]|uniref:LacI family DNA-binding transcriptional regulator n=1 Tax=Pontibacter sp. E15-1 TaxID=2919918 RepID=UPI001F4F9F34|nr:LacI family DNA-binding transcriptional regulator [Pontibacter sp. E15-1]MCJ8165013.1 LacI family transcriptional regulator [Pontibacter sp. E15-1]